MSTEVEEFPYNNMNILIEEEEVNKILSEKISNRLTLNDENEIIQHYEKEEKYLSTYLYKN